MKIIVKSDDYGFTKGVTDGVIEAIKNGIITCTGLFANMPDADYAVERIREYPHIALGIDINVVSGPCLSNPSQIKHLVDDKGEFIRSTSKYADPRYEKASENEELWPYEECFVEACAQVEKFIELTGTLPRYLTGHSISSNANAYTKACRKAAEKYSIPFVRDLVQKYGVMKLPNLNIKPFSIENQFAADVEKNTLKQLECFKDEDYVMIGGHGGYVDDNLLKYSTYTLIRVKDTKMYTSKKIKMWIQEHHAELITFDDLIAEKEALIH